MKSRLSLDESLVDGVLDGTMIDPGFILEPFVRPVFRELTLSIDYLMRRKNVRCDWVYLLGLPSGGGFWNQIAESSARLSFIVPHAFDGLEVSGKKGADAVSDVAGGEVLVVDNDEAILKTTSILLTALKLVPHVAHDRREALALVRRRAKRLRVILLDAHLGGVDTVRLMNAFRIGAPNVPVIVISGSSPAEMAEMFKPHPYDAFLAKPFTMNELKLTISSLTPRKDA